MIAIMTDFPLLHTTVAFNIIKTEIFQILQIQHVLMPVLMLVCGLHAVLLNACVWPLCTALLIALCVAYTQCYLMPCVAYTQCYLMPCVAYIHSVT
jgi:hypothetical protein